VTLVLKDFDIWTRIEEQCHCVVKSTQLFSSALSSENEQRGDSVQRIQELRARGDASLCSAIEHLNHGFVTSYPYGPEDIFRILICLNNVLDLLDLVVGLAVSRRAGDLSPQLSELAGITDQCATKLGEALEAFGEGGRATAPVVAIHRLASDATKMAHEALWELSYEARSQPKPPVEVCELIVRLTDSFKEAARAVEEVMLKHP